MKKYLINDKQVPRYYYSLLHTAECLFADYNGTGDSICWQVQDEMVKFLEARISDWQESKPINKPYDDAVKNLVKTVLWVITDQKSESRWEQVKQDERQALTPKYDDIYDYDGIEDNK